ncbi:MAG: hypothetical protein SOZ56_01875 [Oscillospiraceae bacterium]|nr:hypothetical protein [Oscillospiraceae bacterium]
MTKVNMAAYGLIERFAALAQEYRNNNDNYIAGRVFSRKETEV